MQIAEALLVVVVLLGSSYLAAWLARDAAKRRHKRTFQGAQARWEREEAELRRGAWTSSPGARGGSAGAGFPHASSASASSCSPIVMESFTLGWLNMLVQSMWSPVLERLVSAIAAERLQLVLNEVLRKVSDRRPWKYLERVEVEEVTFGLAPPQFQFANARFDPARQQLHIQVNLRYNSSGFQAVLSPRVRAIGLLKAFSLRLEVTQLLLSGRLNLCIQLTHEAPGIKGVEYSFIQEPEFEIQVSPLGLSGMAGELPGLISSLRGLLLKAMSKKVVEPNRKFLDVQKIYRAKYVRKAGGPGGLVTVTVVGARNLGADAGAVRRPAPAASSGPGPSPASAGHTPSSKDAAEEQNIDPFVEMRFGRDVYRTPVVHHNASSPVWNWQFHLRLQADLPPAAGAGAGTSSEPGLVDDRLRFSVLNATSIGEPEVLCSSLVHLHSLGLEPNGEAVPVLLPLKSASGSSRGSLQAMVRWLKDVPQSRTGKAEAVRPPPQQQQQPQQQEQQQQQQHSAQVQQSAVNPHHPRNTSSPPLPSIADVSPAPSGPAPSSSRTTQSGANPKAESGSLGPGAGSGAGAGAGAGQGASHGSHWMPWKRKAPTAGVMQHQRSGSSQSMDTSACSAETPGPSPRPSHAAGQREASSTPRPGNSRSDTTAGPSPEQGSTASSRKAPASAVSRAEGAVGKQLQLQVQVSGHTSRLRWPFKLRHQRAASELPAALLEPPQPLSPLGPAPAAPTALGRGRQDQAVFQTPQRAPPRCGDEHSTPSAQPALQAASPVTVAVAASGGRLPSAPPGVALDALGPSLDSARALRTVQSEGTILKASTAAAAAAAAAAVPGIQGAPEELEHSSVARPSPMSPSNKWSFHQPSALTGAEGPGHGSGVLEVQESTAGTAFSSGPWVQQEDPRALGLIKLGSNNELREGEGGAGGSAAVGLLATRASSGQPGSAKTSASPDPARPSTPPTPHTPRPPGLGLVLVSEGLGASDVRAPERLAPVPLGGGGFSPPQRRGTEEEPAARGAQANGYVQHQALPQPGANVLQNLVQVVKIQASLDEERSRVQDLTRQLEALQRRHEALSKLRQLENRRALIEGAWFLVHGAGANARLVTRMAHVCYVEADKALRLTEDSSAGAGASASGAAKDLCCSIPVTAIARVDLGSRLFPKGAAADGWTSRLTSLLQRGLSLPRASRHTADSGEGPSSGGAAESSLDLKCLTLVLDSAPDREDNGRMGGPAAAAEGRGKELPGGVHWLRAAGMIHLQMPEAGNGRSRDEWAHGFTDLIHASRGL